MMKKNSIVLAVLLCVATAATAQPSPAIRERIDTIVAALNTSAEAFEQYAQHNFTPEVLARGDAAKRRKTTELIRRDFGQITVRGADRPTDTKLEIGIEGSTGARGTMILDIESAPPHRVSGFGMRIGGRPEREGPPLPPVKVRASMQNDELSKELDGYIGKLAGEGRFSGTVLVAKNGKPVFERAYGFANRADEVPNTTRTRHNLGSINKQFTKVAIAQLAAAGRLALDDALGKYLPEHQNADARKATINQLLNHTAGLGDIFGPDFRKAEKSAFRSNSDYYTFIAPRPMAFAPGTGKQYCNACYITLGEIVTRVSGMPYERHIEQHVLRPAGMTASGFFFSDEVVPRIAIGYAPTPEGVRSNLYMRGAGGSAAGSAFATAADLLAFDNALRDGKLLDAKWTGWFFGEDPPAAGRSDTAISYAGGSGGINASVNGNGQWTVIAMANISPPAAEALAEGILGALTGR